MFYTYQKELKHIQYATYNNSDNWKRPTTAPPNHSHNTCKFRSTRYLIVSQGRKLDLGLTMTISEANSFQNTGTEQLQCLWHRMKMKLQVSYPAPYVYGGKAQWLTAILIYCEIYSNSSLMESSDLSYTRFAYSPVKSYRVVARKDWIWRMHAYYTNLLWENYQWQDHHQQYKNYCQTCRISIPKKQFHKRRRPRQEESSSLCRKKKRMSVTSTAKKLQMRVITCLLPLLFVVSSFTQMGSKRC